MVKKIMTGCLIALTIMVTCGSPVYCEEQLTEGAALEGTVTAKTDPPVQAFDEEALTEKPNIDWEYAVGREMFKNRFSDLEILSKEEEIVQEYLKYLVLEEQKLYPEGVPDGVSYGIPDWGHDVSTGLHQFCERLPKGGDLHVHEYTCLEHDRFIELIKDKVAINLKPGDRYGFLYGPDSDNKPKNAVLLSKALNDNMITRQELKELLTIGDEENLEDGQDWKRAWDKLDLCFQRKRDLKFYPAFLQALYEEAFRQCCENNILLLEIRCGFKDTVEKNTAVHASLREAYYRVRADYPDFRVRIIAAAGKRKDISVEETCDQLRTAIAMRDTFLDEFDPENPEPMIIGLDLINEEDNSLALKEYAKFLYSDEVTDSGLNLFLHCGESLQMDNDSVVDAYLLSALRAGHAFNLFRFPLMMQKYAEEEIAVEICPISNYRLQYVEDLRLHPGLTYLNSGIPGCICSDDGLFMTEHPLVDDFYAVVMNWNLSLADLKVLCRNSILYSGLSMEEITQLLSAWETQWDEFIAVEQKQADRLIEAGVLETETNDTVGDNAA